MLRRGLAAKVLHFLRVHVLKEDIHKETSVAVENRSACITYGRNKDSRIKLPLDSLPVDHNRDVGESTEHQGKSQSQSIGRDNAMKDDEAGRGSAHCESCNVRSNTAYDTDGIDWMSTDSWQWRDGPGRCKCADACCTSSHKERCNNSDCSGGEEILKQRQDVRDRDRDSSKVRGRKICDGAMELEKSGSLNLGSQLLGGIKDRKDNRGFHVHKSAERSGKSTELGPTILETQNNFIGQNLRAEIGGVDISEHVRNAARAAEAEARAANAPLEAVEAAGEAAADIVKTAALEAFSHSAAEKVILDAAKSAAAAVVDAAAATTAAHIPKPESEEQENNEVDPDSSELGDCVPSIADLLRIRERYSIQCLEKLGEYLEVLGAVLHERGVDVCLALLQRGSSAKDTTMLIDTLKLICALAAHRKFSALFVDKGGVEHILALPRLPETYIGVSLCLFAFASVQGVLERVCSATFERVNNVVALALHLLESAPDPARRNAALFFGAAFVSRAILDSFDAQDGLSRMLKLLQNAATIRSGGVSTSFGLSPISRSDRAASSEVLTSYEKQTAYHTCIALRQYFRAQLLILVDSLRPWKCKSAPRNTAGGQSTAYKPLELSGEAVDAVVMQIKRDRKLGPSFVKSRWQAAEKFIRCSGHVTLLELTQVSPEERYLHDIAPNALSILHIITLMPNTRKSIVSSILGNGRSGMAVILDAASAQTEFVEPERIQPALLVLANLVCAPPSRSKCPTIVHHISNASQEQIVNSQGASAMCFDGTGEHYVKQETTLIKGSGDLAAVSSRNPRENTCHMGTSSYSSPAAVVGDRKINLGSAAGCSGLAFCIEQGYRQARSVIRANNGIKVLLHLLSPGTVLPPASSDCIRCLACRVLLGLARDDAIAHILTKLQVGKLLSELLREGSGIFGLSKHRTGDQGRWQVELSQLSMELIALVANAGRATNLVASDAAAPTLCRIERAAIAAATPISYPARELMQLIHEHLVLSGLMNTASELLKEAKLVPLTSVACHMMGQTYPPLTEKFQNLQQLPSGRVPRGFYSEFSTWSKDSSFVECSVGNCRKKGPGFASTLISSQKALSYGMPGESKISTSRAEELNDIGSSTGPPNNLEQPDGPKGGAIGNLPIKRQYVETVHLMNKRLCFKDSDNPLPDIITPIALRGSQLRKDNAVFVNSSFKESGSAAQELQDLSSIRNVGCEFNPGEAFCLGSRIENMKESHAPLMSSSHCQNERATLDSLVVQYLKHQHRQCPAPITTLPPLSLFHPHVCPESSRVCEAPLNTVRRFSGREIVPPFGGGHGRRRDRHFVYSRFRPLRPCRNEREIFTSSAFLGTTFCLATSSQSGDICLFDCHSGNLLESHSCHQSPILSLQSAPISLGGSIELSESVPAHLLLLSGSSDSQLWNSSALDDAPLHNFDDCRLACFNNTANTVAAISTEPAREVLLYDVQTGNLKQRLSESSSSSAVLRGTAHCSIHFSPSDSLLLWKGLLWDHRIPRAVHQFDQFTDYGGGGFHPAGNEVVINSEIWDLRFLKLLRSVPSLYQTTISFNSTGDVIYAILRRNTESIFHHRRTKHPLCTAFKTIDAVDYSEIATTQVDRCVLDLSTEPNDYLISVVGLDGHMETDSFARLYEIGRRKPSDDDSDPDDVGETDDDEDDYVAIADDLHDDEDTDADGSNEDDSAVEGTTAADDGDDDDEAEEDGDADGDMNEEDDEDDDDDDPIEVDGSLVELLSDVDDENGISYTSQEDASTNESDDDNADSSNSVP
ncbi:hypothetical protein KP509_12G050900 [Ceratopteris richardii]|nr:hypothetical protein KP509_12G050900 [Ceratopteris richardii]